VRRVIFVTGHGSKTFLEEELGESDTQEGSLIKWNRMLRLESANDGPGRQGIFLSSKDRETARESIKKGGEAP